MKQKAYLLITLMLFVLPFLLIAMSCDTALPKKYSKFGFSFEYPRQYSIEEIGMQDIKPNNTSGMINVWSESKEEELFSVMWLSGIPASNISSSILQEQLAKTLESVGSAEGGSIKKEQILETTTAGHKVYGQCYFHKTPEGDNVYGILGMFYCDNSSRLFQLNLCTSINKTNQAIINSLQNYLDTFTCH
ncbi:MAG: hypothetical protein PHQ86_03145 [Dehalococcoidales bacterium]|nr:hypothetical protein [Dehalococcoidales bacterium]